MALITIYTIDSERIHNGQQEVDEFGPLPAGSTTPPPATVGTEVARLKLDGTWEKLDERPVPPYDRQSAARAVDVRVRTIYNLLAPAILVKRYDERLAQADEFRGNAYEGEVPTRVQEVMVNAGLADAMAATIEILDQVEALRLKVDALEAERLKRHKITSAANDAAAIAQAAAIHAAIDAIEVDLEENLPL